jgi:hypothetical protein
MRDFLGIFYGNGTKVPLIVFNVTIGAQEAVIVGTYMTMPSLQRCGW